MTNLMLTIGVISMATLAAITLMPKAYRFGSKLGDRLAKRVFHSQTGA